jgi:hypothetical protein
VKTTRKLVIMGLIVALAFCTISLAACGPDTSADQATTSENNTVGQQDNIYLKGQPIPLYNYSIPRDLMIQFYNYEVQDAVNTYSIISDYNGNVVYEGPSMGYPIPFNTELTNPSKLIGNGGSSGYYGVGVVGQDDPNGLYSSPSTNGTIVMFIDPNTGKLMPVYSEQEVTCFPFNVHDSRQPYISRAGSPTALIGLKLSKNGPTVDARTLGGKK